MEEKATAFYSVLNEHDNFWPSLRWIDALIKAKAIETNNRAYLIFIPRLMTRLLLSIDSSGDSFRPKELVSISILTFCSSINLLHRPIFNHLQSVGRQLLWKSHLHWLCWVQHFQRPFFFLCAVKFQQLPSPFLFRIFIHLEKMWVTM